MRFLRVVLAGLVVAAVGAGSIAAYAQKTAKVTILNKSDWEIHEFYLSPADEEEDWGPDQLGDKVIAKGESFTLTGIPCNKWDVRLVDEDGDECVVTGVDLCKASATWEITSKDLLACQAGD